MTTIARSWNKDGWGTLDWETVGIYSRAATKAAQELDNDIGSGGGGFPPCNVHEYADRLEAIAKRLRQLADGYV